MARSIQSMAAWALFMVLIAGAAECRATAALPGDGDDEIDARIEEASIGVRRDRPWRTPGAPSEPVLRTSSEPLAPATMAGKRAGWTFSFTPVLWLPALDGSMTVKGQEIDIDLSIGDVVEGVIDNFQFAAMGNLEARYCRWSIIFGFMYLDLGNEDDLPVPGAAPIDVDWEFQQFFAQLLGGYRFAELPLGCGDKCFRPSVGFDVLAGVRYYSLAGDIDFDPGPSFDDSKNWLDPVVGARAEFNVSRSLAFIVHGNIGGFGVGSDLSWQLTAGIDWRITNCFSIVAGWSILDVDFEDGDFAYDVNMSGPYLGVTFRF